LTRQAAREYGSMSREITDIANEYGLDPEELRSAIVFEAERKVRSAPVEALERVAEGVADPTALPGEAYRVIDLEASYVQSPTIQYTVKPGDTLSSISKRFGTTVESLA